VGEGEAEQPYKAFRPLTERHLGIGACIPEDVLPVGARSSPDDESVATHLAEYARNGRFERGALVLLRVNGGPSRRGRPGVAETLAASVRFVASRHRLLLRRAPRFEAPPSAFFRQPTTTAHRYEGGRLLASAGRDVDGSIVVAVTFGPERWFESTGATSEPLLMHSSVVPLYAYPEVPRR
jgi:hypothetical protein